MLILPLISSDKYWKAIKLRVVHTSFLKLLYFLNSSNVNIIISNVQCWLFLLGWSVYFVHFQKKMSSKYPSLNKQVCQLYFHLKLCYLRKVQLTMQSHQCLCSTTTMLWSALEALYIHLPFHHMKYGDDVYLKVKFK